MAGLGIAGLGIAGLAVLAIVLLVRTDVRPVTQSRAYPIASPVM